MSDIRPPHPARTGSQRAIAVLSVPGNEVNPAQWAQIESAVEGALRASDEVSFGVGGRIHVTLHGVRDLMTAAELMEALRDAITTSVPEAAHLSIGVAAWPRAVPEHQARLEAEKLSEEAIHRGDGRILCAPPLT